MTEKEKDIHKEQETENKAATSAGTSAETTAGESKETPPKKHIIKPRWLRITLRVLGCLLLFILLIPVLLYIPPVQTLVKNIACDFVYKSTGMKIGIDRFRLSFPVDVSLDGVYVLYAEGDTMVRARTVKADVEMLPLFRLDVKLKQLMLQQAYYKMVSPDSSMTLTVNAGLLNVDGGSSANIATSDIILSKATLKDGSLDLMMDVWKKKPTPTDTAASTPFLIKANELDLDNFKFNMSMLPTIDSLGIDASKLKLKNGIIDLRTNNIRFAYAAINGGEATYLTPTPEYIKTHPAPVDTTQSGPPIIIKGDSISLEGFKALYATRGVKPLPGFDAAYISVDDVAIGMRNFYNEASTIRLPITKLQARERSGLQIVSGHGTVGVDSIGLNLDGLDIRTVYSKIAGSAVVPFALMELNPNADMTAQVSGEIGMPDVDAFMPDLKTYTEAVPRRSPLSFALKADGSLTEIDIKELKAKLPGVVNLSAEGTAGDVLAFKKLWADLSFDGQLEDPKVIDRVMGHGMGVNIPRLRLTGDATARRGEFGTDFKLLTEAGDLTADGRVNINSEGYKADVTAHNMDVDFFMKGTGVGKVTARLRAEGRGFNPLKTGAATDVNLDVASIAINHNTLKDITAKIRLSDGVFDINAVSGNPDLNFFVEGNGTIAPDLYTFDLDARIDNADLQKLGFSPDMNNGHGDISLKGTASPDKWLYDAELKVSNFDWNLPDMYLHLPAPTTAKVKTTADSTLLRIDSYKTYADFRSGSGLKRLMDSMTKVSTELNRQLAAKYLDIDTISKSLPPFSLDMNASGSGILSQVLTPSGMSLDTVSASLTKDSIINGNVLVGGLQKGELLFDTLTLKLHQRGHLLDYIAHLGNRKGNLDEFAQVNARGYIGENRASLFVTQFNSEGKSGYRTGLTAAFMDSVISVHFTPLKANIAYLPWTLNADNYVDLHLDGRIQANLQAQSSTSAILIKTEPLSNGRDELHVKLDNIRIQDFLSLSVFAPPITASVNSEMRIRYTGRALVGGGTLGIRDFTYNKKKVGDFDFNLKAGMLNDGATRALLNMQIDGKDAVGLGVRLVNDSTTGLKPEEIKLNLTEFPLKIANPFLGDMAVLSGALNGEMIMDGSFTAPRLNGEITGDSVFVSIPMAAVSLRMGDEPLKVDSNVVMFDSLKFWAANKNPLVVNGSVDARSFSNILLDMGIKGNNVELINSKKKTGSDLYGKLFMNLNANAKGSMSRLDIQADATVLSATDITYVLSTATSQITSQSDNDVVKFVNFNDTTSTVKADSVAQAMNMRIVAQVNIEPGTEVQVDLSSNGRDKVQLTPTANLSFFQNYMGDMRLNGTLTLGNGFARYNIPVVGERSFTFDPNSSVTWNGELMNPSLYINATDNMKASVNTGGNARLVNFLVGLKVTNTLSSPNVSFDLSTNDDLDISNELQSMTADQRSTQAMNLLLYGQYTGMGTKASTNLSGNMLYGFLESKLNSWAASNIKGVDLSFGFDQYDKTRDGNTATTTSYSYQLSKSLFNNRFKIMVGGNYSTDASADENFSENLINDISFEYILKQTQTMNMSVKLYRHTGYESILEGEITEMGAGFVVRRQMGSLRRLFHWLRPKKKDDAENNEQIMTDSVAKPVNKEEHEIQTEK